MITSTPPPHPKPEAIYKAVRSIEALKKSEHALKLDFGETHVVVEDRTTTSCLTGFYAYSQEPEEALVIDDAGIVCNRHSKRPLEFAENADRFARALGFRDDWALLEWAGRNPRIWGNPHGSQMHRSTNAYQEPGAPFVDVTLRHVLKHWRDVARRLKGHLRSPGRNPKSKA